MRYNGILYAKIAGKYVETFETGLTIDAKDARIAELESIRDAEREVHIREIEAWERVHRAMIDERDAARERVAELEAALDGVVTELGGPGYFWIIKDKAIQRAKDALAKGKK
jgi:arginine/ornithine N-succinyltransferase beta subunit